MWLAYCEHYKCDTRQNEGSAHESSPNLAMSPGGGTVGRSSTLQRPHLELSPLGADVVNISLLLILFIFLKCNADVLKSPTEWVWRAVAELYVIIRYEDVIVATDAWLSHPRSSHAHILVCSLWCFRKKKGWCMWDWIRKLHLALGFKLRFHGLTVFYVTVHSKLLHFQIYALFCVRSK